MSFWQKFFGAHDQHNDHKNHVAWVENDCACKTNDQLLQTLALTQDEDVIKGIKRILLSRGFSRKELNQLTCPIQ
ncbi:MULTISPECIES: hypothetical protein [Acinetobacter]|uniref:hypothetical protein n=1 Tax=Acinetobacter TaxID=469 RepID=UPI00124D7D31|nr:MULTISPECIES: hypothetical protein [Acinetobacter]MCG2572545.1 hypothetical protein [Acinetobacter sp. ME22]